MFPNHKSVQQSIELVLRKIKSQEKSTEGADNTKLGHEVT